VAIKPTPITERFWRFVDRSAGDDACWDWTGAQAPGGYGVVGSGGKQGRMVRAHRLSYEMANGPFDKTLFVCHTCDNPPCTNPKHLFLATCKDNLHDMVSKGRGTFIHPRPGERNGRAKLSPAQVQDIFFRYHSGEAASALATEFGVHRNTILNIKSGAQWKTLGLSAEWARRQP